MRTNLAALLIACAAATAEPPRGVQRIAVVVAKYADSDDPELTSTDWRRVLDPLLNAYWGLASDGRISFELTAVQGVCEFDYDTPPDSGEDYDLAGVVGEGLASWNNWSHQAFRELPDAAQYASDDGVNFETWPMLLVMTERRGRAVASARQWTVYTPEQGLFSTVSGALLPVLTGDAEEQPFNPATVLVSPNRVRAATDPAITTMRNILGNCAQPARLMTVLHEVGHLLGQGDLYNEFRGDGDDDFVELWSLMGSQLCQHLDGYTRTVYDWLPDERVVTVPPPLVADHDRTIRLVPPTMGTGRNNTHKELVRLSYGPVSPVSGKPLGLFRGLHLEARLPSSTDNRNLDRSLVNFTSGASTFTYQDGLLVTLVTEKRPVGPCIVIPRRTGSRLQDAAFIAPRMDNIGSVYQRNEDRINVEVVGRDGDALDVRVRWRRKPAPDLYLDPGEPLGESADIWLDSPANGYGTLRFGNRPGDTVPEKCGDFPFVSTVIPWVTPVPGGPSVPGPPRTDRVPHRIHIRVRNVGSAPARRAVGHCVVIERPNLIDFDWNDPRSLIGLGDDRAFTITDLPHDPGANSRVVTIDGFEPKGGPFVIFVWIEPATLEDGTTEPNGWNQLAGEAIVVYQTSQGSPYKPIDLPLAVTNLDGRRRELVFCAMPDRLPAGWQARLDRPSLDLPVGGDGTFNLRLQPAEAEKPGTLRTPIMTGYVNVGCSWAPIGQVPVNIECCTRTTTSLAAKTDGKEVILAGRVSARRAGLGVAISVTDNAGGRRYAGGADGRFAVVPTKRDGSFEARLPYDPKLSYQAVASFGGAPGLEAGASPAVGFGAALPNPRLPPGQRPPLRR